MIRIPFWGRLPSFAQVNLLNQHKSTIKPYIYQNISCIQFTKANLFAWRVPPSQHTPEHTHASHKSELSESLSLSVGQPGHCPSHIRVTGYCLGSRASAQLIINMSDEKIGVFDRLWGFLFVCLCLVMWSVPKCHFWSVGKSLQINFGGKCLRPIIESCFTLHLVSFWDIQGYHWTFCQENRKIYNLKSIS